MSGSVTITAYAVPVAKARARVTKKGRAYTPAKTKAYENVVAAAALKAMHKLPKMEGPLSATLVLYMPKPLRPKWPVPAVRPDLDNILKSVTDACNGIVYSDDAQIVQMTLVKVYADRKKDCRAVFVVEDYGL